MQGGGWGAVQAHGRRSSLCAQGSRAARRGPSGQRAGPGGCGSAGRPGRRGSAQAGGLGPVPIGIAGRAAGPEAGLQSEPDPRPPRRCESRAGEEAQAGAPQPGLHVAPLEAGGARDQRGRLEASSRGGRRGGRVPADPGPAPLPEPEAASPYLGLAWPPPTSEPGGVFLLKEMTPRN